MNYPASFHGGTSLVHPQSDVREPAIPFKYEEENGVFNTMISGHREEETRCLRRRQLRKNRISVKELRDKDQILNDETVIPARTIDTNIRREKAPYVKFIEQSTAVLAFTDPNLPGQNYTQLQTWHTDLVRVGPWKKPHMLNIDAILLHGAGYVEVVFRPDKPSLTDIEYVRRDCLIMPPGTEDIQACTRLYRKYRVTKAQFQALAKKYEFDEAQAKKVTEHAKQEEKFIEIYKGWMRDKDGIVYVVWRGNESSVNDGWLLEPRPLELGLYEAVDRPVMTVDAEGNEQPVVDPVTGQPVTQVQPTPVPIKEYPIFVFPYHVEEDEVILDVQGRAALDLHVQDALTSLWSGTVNGTTRASRFYPTRKVSPGETPKNVELFELKHGHVFEGDFSIFQPAYPNNIAIAAAQALSVNKSQEMGSVDYAAMNRQDTAKTATELNLAQEEADSLGGVNISLFSRCCLEVESLRWRILISNMKLEWTMKIPPEKMTIKPPMNVDPNVMFSPSLVVTMAADAQVVRRAQRQSRFMQYLPAVAGSPYQLPYLEEMLQDMFPDEYVRWKQQVGDADQNKQMLMQMTDMMSKLPAEAVQTLPPEQRNQMVQMMDQVHKMTGPQQ